MDAACAAAAVALRGDNAEGKIMGMTVNELMTGENTAAQSRYNQSLTRQGVAQDAARKLYQRSYSSFDAVHAGQLTRAHDFGCGTAMPRVNPTTDPVSLLESRIVNLQWECAMLTNERDLARESNAILLELVGALEAKIAASAAPAPAAQVAKPSFPAQALRAGVQAVGLIVR
jgi:hypothetical protein